MPLYIEEDAQVCQKCGNHTFVEDIEVVITKDPPHIFRQYGELPRAFVKKAKYLYKCTQCGEILDRRTASGQG